MILYSTGCPRCSVLIQKLNKKNIAYTIESDVQKMTEKGIKSVPVLELDSGIRLPFKEANLWLNDYKGD